MTGGRVPCRKGKLPGAKGGRSDRDAGHQGPLSAVRPLVRRGLSRLEAATTSVFPPQNSTNYAKPIALRLPRSLMAG
jgi:hypothetical protein